MTTRISCADIETGLLVLGLGLPLTTQVFSYDVPNSGRWSWNVTLALELIKANSRPAVEVDDETMRSIAAKYLYEDEHLAAADPSVPGVAAPLRLPKAAGSHIVIDGTHRCVRALRDGVRFRVYLLSDAESERCLLERP